MKLIKITVMKIAQYDDLIEKYENPIEHTLQKSFSLINVYHILIWKNPLRQHFCYLRGFK